MAETSHQAVLCQNDSGQPVLPENTSAFHISDSLPCSKRALLNINLRMTPLPHNMQYLFYGETLDPPSSLNGKRVAGWLAQHEQGFFFFFVAGVNETSMSLLVFVRPCVWLSSALV